jgi:hypothetical protein
VKSASAMSCWSSQLSRVRSAGQASFGGAKLRFGEPTAALVPALGRAKHPPTAVGQQHLPLVGWSRVRGLADVRSGSRSRTSTSFAVLASISPSSLVLTTAAAVSAILKARRRHWWPTGCSAMDGDLARRRTIKTELSAEIQPVGSRLTALTSLVLASTRSCRWT